jgi:hypothetical protein
LHLTICDVVFKLQTRKRFAWLESFRFIAVDSCLVALKLTPTGTSGEASATDNPAALAATAETGDEDSL